MLQRSLGRGRLAHAYLFTGHQVDELEDMARTLAKTLNCQKPARGKAGGAAVVLGHVFPVFLKFRGGKGVAPFAGVLLAYDIPALIVFLIVFLGILILTRYVSLGSIVGAGAAFFVVLFTRIAEASAILSWDSRESFLTFRPMAIIGNIRIAIRPRLMANR